MECWREVVYVSRRPGRASQGRQDVQRNTLSDHEGLLPSWAASWAQSTQARGCESCHWNCKVLARHGHENRLRHASTDRDMPHCALAGLSHRDAQYRNTGSLPSRRDFRIAARERPLHRINVASQAVRPSYARKAARSTTFNPRKHIPLPRPKSQNAFSTNPALLLLTRSVHTGWIAPLTRG